MNGNTNRLQKAKRKWILVLAAVLAAGAAGIGIWYSVSRSNAEPVYVYPFQFLGMTEYWGDSQESHGPVTTDKIQTVFLSDTQTVTEILVQPGDMVKKGDLLMTFDTTLSDLQLERKRLGVEKLKLQLEDAREKLWEINNMEPMVLPTYEEDTETDTDLGRSIRGSYEISGNREYDGSSSEKAILCWIHSDVDVDDSVFLELQNTASEYQELNTPEDPWYEPDGGEEETDPEEEPDLMAGEPSSVSEYEGPLATSFHVVFKVTSGNMSLGDKITWQGMYVRETGSGFTFRFEPAVIPDHMLVEMGADEDSYDEPQIDYGSGYTAAQIAQMRSDQQKKIKDLEFQIKMADAEYRIMQTEVDDGNVYAVIDGEVISCLTEEEAKKTKQPLLKVSGGGGFYVEGFISELEKDNMRIGQEVTVNDWNTGTTYTGSIESIGDFPSQQGYFSGNGNPNASYYPFRVFVDGEADLQAGSYVSVVYSAAESENGIYLENPYLRTEKGRAYVLVRGADGTLEQRFVTTGKSLWGSYTQILSGLTAEDLIAFPYGKNVKPGVPVVEGDMSNLYG